MGKREGLVAEHMLEYVSAGNPARVTEKKATRLSLYGGRIIDCLIGWRGSAFCSTGLSAGFTDVHICIKWKASIDKVQMCVCVSACWGGVLLRLQACLRLHFGFTFSPYTQHTQPPPGFLLSFFFFFCKHFIYFYFRKQKIQLM